MSAAANAASMYTATVDTHRVLSSIRQYYHPVNDQQAGMSGALVHQAQAPQMLCCPQPSPADLSAIVVAVSRLVQAEYGAVHGWGECQLRDKVRLVVLAIVVSLCGLATNGLHGAKVGCCCVSALL